MGQIWVATDVVPGSAFFIFILYFSLACEVGARPVWPRSSPQGLGQLALAHGPAKQGQGQQTSGPTPALGGPVRVGPRARRARPDPWTVYIL